jgi:FSR family fosmidomycin resistance protein-like MFS transporter
MGRNIKLDFETNRYILLYLAIAQTLGKAIGGILAKHIGIFITIISSMALSLITLLFNSNMYLMLIGIFTFNMTMPITLKYINDIFKPHLGFSFGLCASCLFPGYLLAMLFDFNEITYYIVLIMSTIVSLSSILLVYKKEKERTYLNYENI